MLVISSRELRDNQKDYFDKTDEGVQAMILSAYGHYDDK